MGTACTRLVAQGLVQAVTALWCISSKNKKVVPCNLQKLGGWSNESLGGILSPVVSGQG